MDYNARFYSPTLGRFTQPDSVVPEPGSSQAWNRYSYTVNNPVMYNDPSGHTYGGADDGQECTDSAECDLEKDNDEKFEELTEWIDTEIFNQWAQVRYIKFVDPNNTMAYGATGDLAAMAAIVDKAASVYGDDTDALLDALSMVFLGVDQHGPGTMYEAQKDGVEPLYEFGSEGFHSDFADETNQVRHLWASVADTANPGSTAGFIAGFLTAYSGNVTHELLQEGGTEEDFHLSEAGRVIGGAITYGIVDPTDWDQLLINAFGQSGQGMAPFENFP